VVSVFRDTVSTPSVGLVSAIQAGAFWGAVLLPFVYLPMLAILQLGTLEMQLLFASMVSLNVILLIIGHSHRTS
jgi:hypothetical protein